MKEEIQREPISERSALRGRLTSCQRALDALMTRVAHITRHMNDLDVSPQSQNLRRHLLRSSTKSKKMKATAVYKKPGIASKYSAVCTLVTILYNF